VQHKVLGTLNVEREERVLARSGRAIHEKTKGRRVSNMAEPV